MHCVGDPLGGALHICEDAPGMRRIVTACQAMGAVDG